MKKSGTSDTGASRAMRVLIVEDLTSGALPLDEPEWRDLAPEGAAMLCAIAEDARDVPGWNVEVTWSRLLGPFAVPGVGVHFTDSPEQEQRLFTELVRRADRTFVIAPESDRRLEQRREIVETAGGHWVGSSRDALALCGDKLLLAEHLRKQGVSTIPTWLSGTAKSEQDLPYAIPDGVVIKPRDGAGAMNTFHVHDVESLRRAVSVFEGMGTVPIIQPFIAGRAISVAAIVSARGVELFPPASQHIEYGDCLTYLGGCVGEIPCEPAVESLVRDALASVPGLHGYIGVDLILTEGSEEPIVVEINPRLTTSYLGYRRLARKNLAMRIIDPDGNHAAVEWETDRVAYGTGG